MTDSSNPLLNGAGLAHEPDTDLAGAPLVDGGNIDNPDPFDPSRFRISQDFASTAAVKSELTEIAVSKPSKQEFVRVHPSPDYRLDAAIVEYERTTYLVSPELANGQLRDQVKCVTLFTTQNTQRVTYLWPVALPVDGRSNSWTDSARELAMKAMTETLQIKANHHPKAARYDAAVPVGKPPEPRVAEPLVSRAAETGVLPECHRRPGASGRAPAARHHLRLTMSVLDRLSYREVWAVDFEFGGGGGNVPSLAASWPGSRTPGGQSGSGRMSCLTCGNRPTRPMPAPCSSPTTHRPRSAVILHSAGRCRCASLTCSPSGAPRPMGLMSM